MENTKFKIATSLFWRGFLIVFLTALNVSQIAKDHLLASFFTGFAISWVWWMNAHKAAHEHTRIGQWAYALGAGVGTGSGVYIMRLLVW